MLSTYPTKCLQGVWSYRWLHFDIKKYGDQKNIDGGTCTCMVKRSYVYFVKRSVDFTISAVNNLFWYLVLDLDQLTDVADDATVDTVSVTLGMNAVTSHEETLA